MQSTSLHHLPLPTLRTFSRSRKISLNQRARPAKLFLALKRDAYDKNQNGRVVDENMIVLRMRIHDMKMAEFKDDQDFPENWMEWEKKYYCQSYSSDITKAIGMLQLMLMKTRPSFALGMLALVLFGLSYSMVVAVFMLIHMAKFAIDIILFP